MHTVRQATRVLIAVLLMPIGCAPRYTPAPLSVEHPASPDAAEAPLPEHSHTLAIGEVPAASTAPSADVPALYACPMHPEITADKPDQRCPKCGMKLVKQPHASGSGDGGQP